LDPLDITDRNKVPDENIFTGTYFPTNISKGIKGNEFF
jgi:hypothetical protein